MGTSGVLHKSQSEKGTQPFSKGSHPFHTDEALFLVLTCRKGCDPFVKGCVPFFPFFGEPVTIG
jgi:hypothetical protein